MAERLVQLVFVLRGVTIATGLVLFAVPLSTFFGQPAHTVGGDWFTYAIHQDRWLHVHIGDVTGHGTAAALLAALSVAGPPSGYVDRSAAAVAISEFSFAL